jgi:N-acylglucosamine-6-phosphate 2-epimerase
MTLTKETLRQSLTNRLVVSVQAEGDEPLNTPDHLCALAETVMLSGVKTFRMAGAKNIAVFKARHPQTTVIGLTKHATLSSDPWGEVYITPLLADVTALIQAGADVVAVDATQRPRPSGQPAMAWLTQLRAEFPHTPLWADVATVADATMALACQLDVVATTLCGYTLETRDEAASGQPAFTLLSQIRSQWPRHEGPLLVCEGRLWEPWQVREAYERGADAVVVGSAITRPHHIVKRFLNAL